MIHAPSLYDLDIFFLHKGAVGFFRIIALGKPTAKIDPFLISLPRFHDPLLLTRTTYMNDMPIIADKQGIEDKTAHKKKAGLLLSLTGLLLSLVLFFLFRNKLVGRDTLDRP